MNTLDVLVGASRVGVLERFADEDHVFTFDPDWLALPSQDQPLLGQLFVDRAPDAIRTSGLPCWFAHLLPQGPFRRLVARSAGIEELDGFGLLASLGTDLPGAVVLRPASAGPLTPRTIRTQPFEPRPGGLRFSLAGSQLKLSLRQGDRGLVAPVAGETGGWIAKFPDPTFADLPRVEHATSLWARSSGVEVPSFRLGSLEEVEDVPRGLPGNGGRLFLIERFDRKVDGRRIHAEDFGQILDRPPGEPQYSGRYEHIAAVLHRIAPGDVRAFVDRLVFSIVAGNTDAHLKNWAVVYPDGRNARLSPAYDLVSTVLYTPSIDDELALELGGTRRFEDLDLDRFQPLASILEIEWSRMKSWVVEMVDRCVTTVDSRGAEFGYTRDEMVRLSDHRRRLPLVRRG